MRVGACERVCLFVCGGARADGRAGVHVCVGGGGSARALLACAVQRSPEITPPTTNTTHTYTHRAVHVLYSRYDAPRLERVVGSARGARMLAKGAARTFLFC